MTADILLREEEPVDFPEIHRLVEAAFQTAAVKNGDEQNFVERLRAGPNYIPELALVAVRHGGLVGHIMLTKMDVRDGDGNPQKSLLLAPLSVMFEHRNLGIGGMLIREALRRAAEMGFDSVLLAGDPAYYARFGFKRADSFGIASATPIPPQFLLAAELHPSTLKPGQALFAE